MWYLDVWAAPEVSSDWTVSLAREAGPLRSPERPHWTKWTSALIADSFSHQQLLIIKLLFLICLPSHELVNSMLAAAHVKSFRNHFWRPLLAHVRLLTMSVFQLATC